MKPFEELHRYAGRDDDRLDLAGFDQVLARSKTRRVPEWLGPFTLAAVLVIVAILVVAPAADMARRAAAPDEAVARPTEATASIFVDLDAFRGQGRIAFSVGDELHVADGSARTTRLVGTGGAALWSHDGEWLAYTQGAGTDTQLWLSRVDGSDKQRVSGSTPLTGVVFKWSPTAAVLAFAPQGAELSKGLWRVRPGESALLAAAPEATVWSFGWSPDGRQIAYSLTLPFADPAGRSDALFTVDGEGGQAEQRLVAERAGVAGIAWWPDGTGLVYHRVPQHSASLAADGVPLEALALGSREPRVFPEARVEFSDQWIDDRRFIAITGAGRWPTTNKQLAICDIDTLTCREVARAEGAVSLEAALSPDRTRVAFVRAVDRGRAVGFADDSDAEQWMQTRTLTIVDLRSGDLDELRDAGTAVVGPQWSRDGQQILLTSARAAWLYDLRRHAAVKLIGPLDVASPFGGSGWSFDWHR